MRRVIFLSGDLLFASRVRAAAEQQDLDFEMGGQLPEDGQGIEVVILDLATRSGLTDRIVSQIQERCPEARLIAYGPHVHANRLSAAREAGIPIVMTRGQFDQSLGQGLLMK